MFSLFPTRVLVAILVNLGVILFKCSGFVVMGVGVGGLRGVTVECSKWFDCAKKMVMVFVVTHMLKVFSSTESRWAA